MSDRKTRREIDKAIKHLMEYTGPNNEWASLMDELTHQYFDRAATHLQNLKPEDNPPTADDLYDFFLGSPFEHMLFGYVFEEYASVRWDNEEHSLIDAYLKHRGWREGSNGRRYLQALGQSELKLWEITAVRPGSYAEIRLYGSSDKPIRVKEKAATQDLHQWDGLVARVLRVGNTPMFSGAMLPFTPDIAGQIHAALAGIPDETRAMVQEFVDSGELELDALPDDIDMQTEAMIAAELPAVAFTFWAVDLYWRSNEPLPEMRNMDDEPIALTELRFSVEAKPAALTQALNSSPVLDQTGPNTWTWLPRPVADIADDDRVSILGHIELTPIALRLETNSVARAERGGDMLALLLGDLVGKPLTVHNNLQQSMMSGDSFDIGEQAPEELQAVLEKYLTDHYRQTLDEPIPMLNNKTPRQCAADPVLRNEAIGWLKDLENSHQRSPQASYDFSWMWDELKLPRH